MGLIRILKLKKLFFVRNTLVCAMKNSFFELFIVSFEEKCRKRSMNFMQVSAERPNSLPAESVEH